MFTAFNFQELTSAFIVLFAVIDWTRSCPQKTRNVYRFNRSRRTSSPCL